MSNLNFAEFANTLQAAQAAIDNAPKLEQERNEALSQRDAAQAHAQSLEERINGSTGYKVFISQLEGRLREAEDARDTFRLEAHAITAKLDRLVSAFTSASDMVADEIRQVMPPAPPKDEPTEASGASAEKAGEGSSAVGPSSTSLQHTSEPQSGSGSPSADPGPAIGASMSHPYAGKAYYDHPVFVPYHAWLDGGGTDYGYNWRPNASGEQPIQSRLSAPQEVLSDGKPESQSIGYGSDQKQYS